MEQYAVIGNHPPDNCPMANTAVREFAKKTYAKLPKLLKQLNVKILMDIHLDPGHKVFMLFEAPNAEAVRDLLVMAGFSYFLDSEFYLVTPIGQLLKHIEDMPTLH
jgi:hypothetical protein